MTLYCLLYYSGLFNDWIGNTAGKLLGVQDLRNRDGHTHMLHNILCTRSCLTLV